MTTPWTFGDQNSTHGGGGGGAGVSAKCDAMRFGLRLATLKGRGEGGGLTPFVA